MPIRDFVIVGFLLYTIPHVLRRPWLGVLVWSWISYMNPHRLCWSFAYSFPVAAIAGGTLIVSAFMSKEKLRVPKHPLVLLLCSFIIWLTLSFITALNAEGAYLEWNQAMKIHLITFFILALINDRKRVIATVAAIAFSIGYFGIKGGVFALATGLSFRVWGPPGSFIEGNNEMALALLMVMPLLRFLQLQTDKKWQRHALTVCLILITLSVISSYSRGAFLGLAAAGFLLIMKSRQRLPLLLLVLLSLPIIAINVPQQWVDRMSTIKTYEQDASAMGRINAWWFAVNLANDRPLTGGGLRTFTKPLFLKYAPNPVDHHDAHSIYFEILGEMGYVGLILFVSLFLGAYISAGRTARLARGSPELQWAVDLCLMLQVSLVVYGTGGAFLGLAYFDLPYHIVAIVIIVSALVRSDLQEKAPPTQSWVPESGPVRADTMHSPR